MNPTLTVRDDGRPEAPNASTIALARLVCEHGTVLWVSFGSSDVGLRTDPSPVKPPDYCGCQPAVAVIYPPKP